MLVQMYDFVSRDPQRWQLTSNHLSGNLLPNPFSLNFSTALFADDHPSEILFGGHRSFFGRCGRFLVRHN